MRLPRLAGELVIDPRCPLCLWLPLLSASSEQMVRILYKFNNKDAFFFLWEIHKTCMHQSRKKIKYRLKSPTESSKAFKSPLLLLFIRKGGSYLAVRLRE